MAYKSGNPALNKNTFSNVTSALDGEAMTLDGVAGKSLLLLLLCVGSGYAGWQTMVSQGPDAGLLVLGGAIAAFIVALITVFKKRVSPITAPIYALLEGFVVGAVSQLYEVQFQGIVLQALLVTGGIFFSMLVIYRLRLIRATENFKLGVAAATAGIAIYYLANLVINFFGKDLPLIASNSIYGILFSVFVVVLAALNLVIDFDFIESGVAKRAPKYMEWYASFGLLVTVVWLYLEILRLLGKARSR